MSEPNVYKEYFIAGRYQEQETIMNIIDSADDDYQAMYLLRMYLLSESINKYKDLKGE